jgi:hypothetical protein
MCRKSAITRLSVAGTGFFLLARILWASGFLHPEDLRLS